MEIIYIAQLCEIKRIFLSSNHTFIICVKLMLIPIKQIHKIYSSIFRLIDEAKYEFAKHYA